MDWMDFIQIGMCGALCIAALIWVVVKVATPPGSPSEKESQQRCVDKERLASQGYWLDLDGKTRCTACGTNCGQCGEDRSGLTLREYKERYWK